MPKSQTILRFIFAAALCMAGAVAARAQEEAAFPYPAIPQELRTPQERGAWLLEHYWDGYDFADTTLIRKTEVPEQGFANFVDLLPRFDSLAMERGVDAFAQGAFGLDTPRKVRSHFVQLTELYLFDEASPMRSDSLYARFLRRMAAAPAFDVAERGRFSWLLGMIGRNQRGSIAADFSYADRNGHRSSLQNTDAELLLLYFHDPGCDICHTVTAQLSADSRLTADPRVKVLAIAPDADEAAWRDNPQPFPSTWIDAHCIDGTPRQLYFIRSLPAIYLLDKDRRVLLKEPPADELTAFLAGYLKE